MNIYLIYNHIHLYITVSIALLHLEMSLSLFNSYVYLFFPLTLPFISQFCYSHSKLFLYYLHAVFCNICSSELILMNVIFALMSSNYNILWDFPFAMEYFLFILDNNSPLKMEMKFALISRFLARHICKASFISSSNVCFLLAIACALLVFIQWPIA